MVFTYLVVIKPKAFIFASILSSMHAISTVRYLILLAIIAGCLGSASVLADISVIPEGGTVFVGEEGIDISACGISDGTHIAWWAPGSKRDGEPTRTEIISNIHSYYVMSAIFDDAIGRWYTYPEKNPVFTVSQPSLTLQVWDTVSDFDATNKWLPKGHIAAFRIVSNLESMAERGSGAPVTIKVETPSGAELTAVSGFPLTNISITQQIYLSEGVWNTGEYESGTYTLWAEATANSLSDNNPKAVSEKITLLIQGMNPLSKQRDDPSTEVRYMK